ncbi:hypothetical protein [Enterobacter asburiae]|uniref:hypothetical protein n=1 Tax=Enterobacter asburiae TaxID=61645 RepID=UPI001C5BBADF|nr:hypothetical protein [Enterobacter asburiae]EMD2766223.1 hypothetical protein [Enterobacter asburiae]MBW4212551.1 hypothetical protein [Enterobacter asburiae]
MKHEKLLRPVQFVPYIMAAAPYYTKNRMGIKNRNSAGQDVKKYKTKRCAKNRAGFCVRPFDNRRTSASSARMLNRLKTKNPGRITTWVSNLAEA